MIEHIDPFIGVNAPGECLPGPYLPLGLVRLSPDTVAPQPTSGYRSSDPIQHFSHTHVAGTGVMSRYGNIGVVPFTGPRGWRWPLLSASRKRRRAAITG